METKENEKKYYSCYREGILTSDVVEEEYLYCEENKIRLPSWFEIDKECAETMMNDGIIFKEL